LKEEGMAEYTALIRGMVVIWAMVTVAFTGSSASADELQVTKIRGDSVDLFSCDDLSKSVGQVSQNEFRGPGKFRGPWPATKQSDRPLFLRVVVDGDRYCVKAYLVEANTTMPATSAAGECKPKGGKQPKPGFSRGVGEGC
jgi:hypothetical protein